MCVYICTVGVWMDVLCACRLSLAAVWTEGGGTAADLPLFAARYGKPNTNQPQHRLPQQDSCRNPYLFASLQRTVPFQACSGWLGVEYARAGKGGQNVPLKSSCVHVSREETRQGCLYFT